MDAQFERIEELRVAAQVAIAGLIEEINQNPGPHFVELYTKADIVYNLIGDMVVPG